MPMPKLNDIQEFLTTVENHRADTTAAAKERARLAADREKLIDTGKALGFEKGAVREMLDEGPAQAEDARS